MPLHTRGCQAGLRLGDAGPCEGNLAFLDQHCKIGALLGVGFPKMLHKKDLLQGVAVTRIAFRQTDSSQDILISLAGIDGKINVPIRVPVRKRDEKYRAVRPRHQGLGLGIQDAGSYRNPPRPRDLGL
jgi:hypothetical protein